jgi:formylglycine-generating enzyme required for sulfatase activity
MHKVFSLVPAVCVSMAFSVILFSCSNPASPNENQPVVTESTTSPEALCAKPADGSVTLSWSPSPRSSSYTVFYSTDSSFSGTFDSVRNVNAPFTIRNLQNSTTYFFAIASLVPVSRKSAAISALPKAISHATIGMKLIPAGTFTMGTDTPAYAMDMNSPAHQVTLSSFYMDSTEVTQAEYFHYMSRNPSLHNGSFSFGSLGRSYGTDFSRPVEAVCWYEAVLFCNARSKTESKDTVYSYTGKRDSILAYDANILQFPDTMPILLNVQIDYAKNGYRLPTEAEFEYALKGGSSTIFYWGNDSSIQTMSQYEWFTDNSSANLRFPVASKKPNGYGLYDMIFNGEWCNDWSGAYQSAAQTDPAGPTTGTNKTFRGVRGRVMDGFAEIVSSVRRDQCNPDYRLDGFRCVLPNR